MNKEIYNLQILRGMAALLVVISHLLAYPYSYMKYTGQIGVAIFFILSGFLMMYTFNEKDTAFGFFKKRIKRIYPTYFLVSIPLVLFFAFNNESISIVFHNLFFIPWLDKITFDQDGLSNPAAWTLFFEFYFYLIFALSKVFFKKKTQVGILTTIIIISLLVFSRFKLEQGTGLGWSEVTLASVMGNLCVLYFIGGMWLSYNYENKRYNIKHSPSLLLLIPLSIVILKISSQYIINQQVVDLIFNALLMMILVFTFLHMENLKSYFINKLYNLGLYSYSLYLVHAYFYLIRMYLESHGFHGVYLLLISVFMLFSSLYLSKIIYFRVERRFIEFFSKSKGLCWVIPPKNNRI